MARKVLVWLASATLSIGLFLAVTSFVAVQVFTPTKIKTWLKSSNVYTTIVDDVLDGSKVVNNDGSKSISLEDPAVRRIAKQTFSPNFIQSSTEQVIDGTKSWLDGAIPKPAFSIDLSKIKSNFADNIGNYALERYTQLPVCDKGSPLAGGDILSVFCQTPGVDPNVLVRQSVADLKQSKDFLPDTSITADTILVGQGASKQPLYQKLDKAPSAYRFILQAPYIFGGLSLLCLLVAIFASHDRRSGIRRVTRTLIVVCVYILIELAFIYFGVRALNTQLVSSGASQGLARTMVEIVSVIKSDAVKPLTLSLGTLLILAMGLIIYLLMTRSKKIAEPRYTGSSDRP